MIQSVIFGIVTIAAFAIAGKKFLKIRRNILLGKDESIEGDSGKRWKNVLLVAFGQQKMFKNWIPAIFHFFIYAAFLLTQIELIEILIDGFSGQHRFFAPLLGGFYTFLINFIEILSVLALIATIVFLMRRNVLKVPRFFKPEMKGWPFKDGNLILVLELLLLIGIFSMNGADVVLQSQGHPHYPDTGHLLVSSNLGPALFGGLDESTLILIERFGWWLHILVVFAFLNYLPYSKHLHIFFAFPNTYYANTEEKGTMENMPSIMNEVKSMMGFPDAPASEMGADGELPVFGSNDIHNLSWKNILDAYSCTECGRCTAQCPANQTGKKLSPRKIMMDVRDRAEEVGKKLDSGSKEFIRADKQNDDAVLSIENFDDQKSLFDYIAREEIHACTTCNACVEACPVLIDPLDIIYKLRRYEILTESAGPGEWLPLFNSIENGGSAWQMSQDRDKWATDMEA